MEQKNKKTNKYWKVTIRDKEKGCFDYEVHNRVEDLNKFCECWEGHRISFIVKKLSQEEFEETEEEK